MMFWREAEIRQKKRFRATRAKFISKSNIVEFRGHLEGINCELPDFQAGFRKGRGTRDQIANIRWIIKKLREFQKNIYFCFIDYAKAFDCVDHNKLWEILSRHTAMDHRLAQVPSPNSTVSLTSQRHPENLPEVTGTSRGNPGILAKTRERS